METNRDNNAPETAAPARLIAALRRTQPARIFVPKTVDEVVLQAAQRQLTPQPAAQRNLLIRWFLWPAFAAALLAVCTLTWRFTRPGLNSNPSQTHLRADVNQDGRVDILDAFQLARQLKSGTKPSPGFDLNGDGVVDERDTEVIAVEAVKLEKGRHS